MQSTEDESVGTLLAQSDVTYRLLLILFSRQNHIFLIIQTKNIHLCECMVFTLNKQTANSKAELRDTK